MFQKLIYSLFPGLLKNQLKVLIAGTIEGDKQKKGKLHDLLERLGDSIEGALREVIMDPDDQDDPYEANIALKKRYPKREYAEQGIERYTWENALGEGQVRPLRFFVPTIFQELLDAVKFAENRGLKVKAVATGHSYSDITKTQDVLISMLNLNSPLELPKSSFKEGVDSSNFFNTQAGIRLRELNDAMDQAGLALPTMPGVDLQTLGGAISSATHGSSMEYASLSELVRSLVVVSSDNKVYRIEPSDGITDPSKHDEPGVELVQDDDWFNSVTCSMGCMGIIYSIVIEVIPSYMLSETKTLTTWDEVKKGLESGELFEGNRHLEIMINPYKIDGTHKTLVLHQEIVSDQEPTGNRKFSFLATLVDILPVGRKLLKWYANTFPEKTPQLIDTSLNGLVQTEPFINKSYKVLNQGLMEIKDDGLATEMALPFDKYIGAVDHLIEMINQMKEDGDQYMTSPISLRFGKKSDIYLSMQYGWNVCMVDLPILGNTYALNEVYDRFQEYMFGLAGRPHWGKVLNLLNGEEMLQAMYPKLPEWKKVFAELNPKGTFNNDFVYRCGFDMINAN